MTATQTSLIRAIDRKETKENVERAFADYRMYMMAVPDDIMPKVTPSYSILPPSNTNALYSSTEDTAIKRVDYKRKRDNFMKRVQKAVNRLSKRERELIIKTYMTY
ncbi:ArpU family phage packaging/lysis transcriptional regulator, partial [Priestia megaterium]|uniref:ArpU family phage packaging/lysis transcriptional regulator n=1 Tax=Priestia megaterium TaxID=1404 RepID=UPI00300BBC2C